MTTFDWYVVVVAIIGIPLMIYGLYLEDWQIYEEEDADI